MKNYLMNMGSIQINKLNKKFDCECGGKYIYKHKVRHNKSIKHQKYLLRKKYLLPDFKSCSL